VAAGAPAAEGEAVARDARPPAISEALLAEELERPWRRNPFEAATAVPASILLLVARDFPPLEPRRGRAAGGRRGARGAGGRDRPRASRAGAGAGRAEPCPALWRQMAVGAAGGGAE